MANKTQSRTASPAKTGTTGKEQSSSTSKRGKTVEIKNPDHVDKVKGYVETLKSGHDPVEENAKLREENKALHDRMTKEASDGTAMARKRLSLEDKLGLIFDNAVDSYMHSLDLSSTLHKKITGADRPKSAMPGFEMRGLHDKLDGLIEIQKRDKEAKLEISSLVANNL